MNACKKTGSRVIVYLDIKVSDERCQGDGDDVLTRKLSVQTQTWKSSVKLQVLAILQLAQLTRVRVQTPTRA